MSDDYPTTDDLKRIKLWPLEDLAGALDFVSALWSEYGRASNDITAHEAGVVRAEKDTKYLRLATGGWSGNEEIVAAMQANRWLMVFCWRLAARGGLTIWEYPA